MYRNDGINMYRNDGINMYRNDGINMYRNDSINKLIRPTITNLLDLNDRELFDLLDEIDSIGQKNIINNYNCIECDSNDFIIENESLGIVVCTICGIVINNILDKSPEWKQYSEKDTIGRCGQPTNFFLPQSSLSTTIACSNRNKLKILQDWNAMPYKERSLNNVLKEIRSKCYEAKIIKCIEDDAKILYKNISECKYVDGKKKGNYIIKRGNNRRGLIAACIFYACKRNGRTRSPKEIEKLFNLKSKEMTRGCKTFNKLMGQVKILYNTQISMPEHFVSRYCKELHILKEYIQQALKLAQNIQKLDIVSMHTPFIVAIGGILLAIDLNKLQISKKAIAEKFSISEVTIVKIYKKIEQYKKILVNDNLTNKLVQLIEEEKEKMKMPEEFKKLYQKVKVYNINDTMKYINKTNKDINNKLKATEQKFQLIMNEIKPKLLDHNQ